MKHIKLFEAFKLPDRNPNSLIMNCFSSVTDECGDQVEWRIYPDNQKILACLDVKQILKKSEMEEFCEEYILPGIGRMADEGFKFTPKKDPKLFWVFNIKEDNEIFYKGIQVVLRGDKTTFRVDFKSEL